MLCLCVYVLIYLRYLWGPVDTEKAEPMRQQNRGYSDTKESCSKSEGLKNCPYKGSLPGKNIHFPLINCLRFSGLSVLAQTARAIPPPKTEPSRFLMAASAVCVNAYRCQGQIAPCCVVAAASTCGFIALNSSVAGRNFIAWAFLEAEERE